MKTLCSALLAITALGSFASVASAAQINCEADGGPALSFYAEDDASVSQLTINTHAARAVLQGPNKLDQRNFNDYVLVGVIQNQSVLTLPSVVGNFEDHESFEGTITTPGVSEVILLSCRQSL